MVYRNRDREQQQGGQTERQTGPYDRQKNDKIYGVVGGFGAKGPIQYVAHLIMKKDGAAIQLGKVVDDKSGNGKPQEHPDQTFWQDLSSKGNTLLQETDKIDHIAIDCTAMPCDHQYVGCLYKVPRLIRKEINNKKPLVLRIFSHRFEKVDLGSPSKASAQQMIECSTADEDEKLLEEYKNSRVWDWK